MMARRNNNENNRKKLNFLEAIKKIREHYLTNEILGWLFIFISIFTFISDLDKGGIIGAHFKNFLLNIFGLSHFAIIILFLILGIGYVFKINIIWKIDSTIALVFLFFIFNGFIEIFTKNGGSLGKEIIKLNKFLGDVGLIILFLILTILSLTVIFEKPFIEIIRGFKRKKKIEGVEVKEFIKKEEVKEEKKMKMPEIIKLKNDKNSVKEEIRLKRLPIKTTWELPPLSLLDKTETAPDSGDLKENIQIIKNTFLNFGIDVEIVEVTIGPTVTRYAVKPPEGIKLSKILSLQNDLALALAAQNIRIEAPIPGRALMGIEIPNKKRAIVRLRYLLENPEFLESESLLLFPVGRLITGEPFYSDLALMPHILIAGTTGSGKSVFIHSLLISLLLKNTPETLNLILIDPKRVELIRYEDLPHLLMEPIVETKKVVPVMNWLIKEMEKRYLILQENRVRDIDSFNKKQIQRGKKILPRVVFVIDEMADLMIKQGHLIEATIVRLTQMARATGIHLVLATQRPSVDVVTGLIKANIPNRICFKVASQVDSRTVLDYAGAEKLIGAGDMLFVSTLFGGMKRIQAPFIAEKEIERVINFWAKQAEEKEDFEKEEISLEEYEKPEFLIEEDIEDDLIKAACEIILETGKASTSLLQRKLKIGYARAARILDILEEKGIVGPQEGTKPRRVLIEKLEDINENGKEVE
ncbi:MAG: DNA translocase FtsK [Minisyncoccia bacterium]